MYFKDEEHKEGLEFLLSKFGLSDVESDVYYGSLAYLVSATGKERKIVKTFKRDGSVDSDKYMEIIQVYSSSEQALLKFALQCFNSRLSKITIADVFYSLDSQNSKVVKQAIEIRY